MSRTCPWKCPSTNPTLTLIFSTLQAACAPLPSLQLAHPPCPPTMTNCVLYLALISLPKSTLVVALFFLTSILLSTPAPRAQICLQARRRKCLSFPHSFPAAYHVHQLVPVVHDISCLRGIVTSFSSPDLPFRELSMNDQDHLQACQSEYPLVLLFSPNSQSYSTPPKQPYLQPVDLPEELCTDVPIITDQSVGINNTGGAFPGSNSFLTVPSFSEETTALGLYYPSTPHSFHIPPLSIQADASILSTLPPPAPPAATRKVRAVAPTARTKRVRSGKIRPPSHAVGAASTGAASGTDEECVLKCPVCGFPQSTQRKGDFLRHMRTHEDAKLTRYVCCGIHAAHPATATLRPGHSVHLYKGCAFYGGCGKSYSRMDALQRHLGKSGCAGGSAKDHQIWRQLYL
jgi:hypothetical protein